MVQKEKILSDKIRKSKSPQAMVTMKNKLEIIESKIAESLNQDRVKSENTAIDKIKENSKFFFKYAKKFSKCNENIGPLQEKSGNIVNNNEDMAKILANQYRSVFLKPLDTYPEYSHQDYNCGIMKEVLFTEENISKNIMRLKNSSSPGPDCIISECYKYGGSYMKDALIDIFSQMYDEGYSPYKSRLAWISPTWKGKSKLDPANYRPIALTNNLSKIFEGVIREHILNHLSENNAMDITQHGSIKGMSTTSQLLEQIKYVHEILENGSNLELIYLDFSKAYDRVDHKILLSKLEKMGIIGKNLNFIEHWLTQRKQRVKVADSLSQWDEMISGIPQGSVLGPLLFILFIWDLGMDLREIHDPKIMVKLLKYIDDTKIIGKVSNEDEIEVFQSIMNNIYKCETENNML